MVYKTGLRFWERSSRKINEIKMTRKKEMSNFMLGAVVPAGVMMDNMDCQQLSNYI